MANSKLMTKAAAARIQSAIANINGGATPKNSFASRTQSTSTKNSSEGGK